MDAEYYRAIKRCPLTDEALLESVKRTATSFLENLEEEHRRSWQDIHGGSLADRPVWGGFGSISRWSDSHYQAVRTSVHASMLNMPDALAVIRCAFLLDRGFALAITAMMVRFSQREYDLVLDEMAAQAALDRAADAAAFAKMVHAVAKRKHRIAKLPSDYLRLSLIDIDSMEAMQRTVFACALSSARNKSAIRESLVEHVKEAAQCAAWVMTDMRNHACDMEEDRASGCGQTVRDEIDQALRGLKDEDLREWREVHGLGDAPASAPLWLTWRTLNRWTHEHTSAVASAVHGMTLRCDSPEEAARRLYLTAPWLATRVLSQVARSQAVKIYRSGGSLEIISAALDDLDAYEKKKQEKGDMVAFDFVSIHRFEKSAAVALSSPREGSPRDDASRSLISAIMCLVSSDNTHNKDRVKDIARLLFNAGKSDGQNSATMIEYMAYTAKSYIEELGGTKHG